MTEYKSIVISFCYNPKEKEQEKKDKSKSMLLILSTERLVTVTMEGSLVWHMVYLWLLSSVSTGCFFIVILFDAMVLRMYVFMVENALLSQSLLGSLAKKYIK